MTRDSESDTEERIDHPLPVGTVLTTADGSAVAAEQAGGDICPSSGGGTADGSVVKTITDRFRDGTGLVAYETYTVNGSRETIGRQTRKDLDEIVENYFWSVRYRPDGGDA